MDGSLKLAGLDPLPSEMERGPKFELPPPALQICGFKDGRATEPAEYHTWEKADHMAESFEMVRQRWLVFPTNSGIKHTILCETEAVGRTYGEESRRCWLCPGQNQKCGFF